MPNITIGICNPNKTIQRYNETMRVQHPFRVSQLMLRPGGVGRRIGDIVIFGRSIQILKLVSDHNIQNRKLPFPQKTIRVA